MKLLLDTHIWLWSILEPARLGRKLRRELEKQDNELWLSSISTWEFLLLNDRGRIRVQGDLSEWLQKATVRMREAPLTHRITMVAHQISLPHRDPADRFLAATAQVLDLTLATADEHLLGLDEIKTLSNR